MGSEMCIRDRCKARYSELVAGAVNKRAEEIGMRVNGNKTQLLMVSQPNGFNNRAYLTVNGNKVESGNEMKLLGFVFGERPNADAHVKEIKRKFRGRFWSLIHLRRSGFTGNELMNLFNIFVRPIIEYCCVIYHPLLTVSQSDEIEKMQRQAAKLAFGWHKSYDVICAEQNIQTLKTRREAYIDSFTLKALRSNRFSTSWFPLRDQTEHDLRDRRPYRETRARTKRFFNSPLSFMRRRANDLFIEASRDIAHDVSY